MNDSRERFLAYIAYKNHCLRMRKKYPNSYAPEIVSFADWIDAWMKDDDGEWHER